MNSVCVREREKEGTERKKARERNTKIVIHIIHYTKFNHLCLVKRCLFER